MNGMHYDQQRLLRSSRRALGEEKPATPMASAGKPGLLQDPDGKVRLSPQRWQAASDFQSGSDWGVLKSLGSWQNNGPQRYKPSYPLNP